MIITSMLLIRLVRNNRKEGNGPPLLFILDKIINEISHAFIVFVFGKPFI